MYLYTHAHTRTYTHTHGTPKNIQTPITGIMAVMKHTSTLPFTRLGTARSTGTRHTSILQSMHGRHGEAPLLGTTEKGRRKGKESEAGLVSMSPDTQVKEQQVSVTSFLKMSGENTGDL